MSAPNQGRQSPPPERQTGSQQRDPPSDAKGVNLDTKNQDNSKSDVDVSYPQWIQ